MKTIGKLLALMMLVAAAPAVAQSYPAKPIRLIVNLPVKSLRESILGRKMRSCTATAIGKRLRLRFASILRSKNVCGKAARDDQHRQ